jgi:hypothetical protein
MGFSNEASGGPEHTTPKAIGRVGDVRSGILEDQRRRR